MKINLTDPIVSVSDYMEYYNITDMTQAKKIEEELFIASEVLLNYLKNTFMNKDGIAEYPRQVKGTVREMTNYKIVHGASITAGVIKSESVKNHSISYAVGADVQGAYINGYPTSIIDACKRFKLPYWGSTNGEEIEGRWCGYGTRYIL